MLTFELVVYELIERLRERLLPPRRHLTLKKSTSLNRFDRLELVVFVDMLEKDFDFEMPSVVLKSWLSQVER